MHDNDVWDLVYISKVILNRLVLNGSLKPRGSEDVTLNVLNPFVTKGFTEREMIDFNDTFLPVLSKHSLRIIMALIIHLNLNYIR